MKFKAEAQNQLDRKIKRFRFDSGSKYITKTPEDFYEVSAPYAPQQHGVAEQKNRTLKKIMNSMTLSSGLSDNMWVEAVLCACYILNRVPHKKLT